MNGKLSIKVNNTKVKLLFHICNVVRKNEEAVFTEEEKNYLSLIKRMEIKQLEKRVEIKQLEKSVLNVEQG